MGAALVRILIVRRPPYFARPRTLVDHVEIIEHDAQKTLLLIPKVEPLIPRGAEVACFRPKNGDAHDDGAVYLTAVGMLPHHTVLPPFTAAKSLRMDQSIEWVIAVGAPLENGNYKPVAGFPEGWLYRRADK